MRFRGFYPDSSRPVLEGCRPWPIVSEYAALGNLERFANECTDQTTGSTGRNKH